MQTPVRHPRGRDTLSLRLGHAFEAHATGRGVAAVVVVILLLSALAALKLLLG